jgi:hypothetical protein
MRVMVIMKATKESEAGVPPDERLLTEMKPRISVPQPHVSCGTRRSICERGPRRTNSRRQIGRILSGLATEETHEVHVADLQ